MKIKKMRVTKPHRFLPYLFPVRNSLFLGVRDDTPEDIKKEYEEYIKWRKENPQLKPL